MQLSSEEDVRKLALTIVGKHFVVLRRHDVIKVKSPSKAVDGGGKGHNATAVSKEVDILEVERMITTPACELYHVKRNMER